MEGELHSQLRNDRVYALLEQLSIHLSNRQGCVELVETRDVDQASLTMLSKSDKCNSILQIVVVDEIDKAGFAQSEYDGGSTDIVNTRI